MGRLRAGFAKEVITPGRECSLVGYAFRFEAFGGGNEGVLDPLFARAVYVEGEGACGYLLVALDLCVLETALATELRDRLGAALDLPASRIVLACSHTHSGPFPQSAEAGGPETPQLQRGAERAEANVAYTAFLLEALIRIGRKARGLTEPVSFHFAEFLCEFGYKRRVPTPGGLRVCWNVFETPDRPPDRQPDPTVSALILRQVSGRSLVLWSAGVHPVCLGKTSNVVSADWPGRANALLAEWLPGAEGLYFHGAAGEVHPWIATQDRTEPLDAVGRAAAAPLALAARTARSVEVDAVAHAEVPLPGDAGGGIVTLLRVGPVALLFLPVELFASLGWRVRQAFQQAVFFSTVSNGWEGYWPDEAAFAEGGYEVEAARSRGRGERDGEDLADLLIRSLREIGHT
jgi:neutral ceramidase